MSAIPIRATLSDGHGHSFTATAGQQEASHCYGLDPVQSHGHTGHRRQLYTDGHSNGGRQRRRYQHGFGDGKSVVVSVAAPTVTTPTITSNDLTGPSTVSPGDVLTALAAGNGLSDDHITYVWYSSANGYQTPIQAGGNTYAVQLGDIGKTFEVVATSTNGLGETVAATSAPTSAAFLGIDHWTHSSDGNWQTSLDWDRVCRPH